MSQTITVDHIKHAAIRRLKSYYKERKRLGETVVAYDQASPAGVIADATLSFSTNEGNQFLATVEATSADTKQEVIFDYQRNKLLWDSAVIAMAIITLGSGVAFSLGYLAWTWPDLLYPVLALVFLGLATAMIYNNLAKNFHRYKYIYAIEQFKTYHADDQWIALGNDVFKQTTDPYLGELRYQCLLHGFGLMIIDPDGLSEIIIAPSRQELFGKSKKRSNLLKRSPFGKMALFKDSGVVIKNQLLRPEMLGRFRKYPVNQWLLIGLAGVILGLIFYKVYDLRPETMMSKNSLSLEEVKPKPERPNQIGYVEPPMDSSGRLPEPKGAYKDKGFEAPIHTGKHDYDCSRFENIATVFYLVQDGVYHNLSEALDRQNQLMSAGLDVTTLWFGCFYPSNSSYVVFSGKMHESLPEARSAQIHFKKALKEHQLLEKEPAVRQITKNS